MKKLFTLGLVAAAISVSAATPASPTWKKVAASDNSTFAIKADGTLWGWGDNETGQLSLGSTETKCSSTPIQIGTDTSWSEVYGARGAGFFIKNDGTLWTVGSNEKGQSGVGDGVTNHKSLIQVGTDTNWKSLATSITWCNTVLGIKTDGTLWAWGDGTRFCLGRGNTNNSAVPVQVGTDNDWAYVVIGTSHVMALKTDGSLWGWGFAPYGQLMNAEQTSLRTPTRLGNDTWSKVYAIDNASYGIKADGTLWAWGDNQTNHLGLNSDMSGLAEGENLPNVYVPTQITMVPGQVTAVSGCENVRVVVADGKVYAWGSNGNGALGNGKGEAFEVGNAQMSATAVQVSMPADIQVATLSCGQRFSALLDNNGVLYGWGSNRWGQMGNYADSSKLTFCPSPIMMGVPTPPPPGEYTFDASNIPGSLSDAVKITMIGEWDTAALQKMCAAIGANLGFPPVGNKTLVSVDMSKVTFAPNTSLYVPAGFQNAGVFKQCKSLETITFPSNESVANIVNLQEAFMNCSALRVCDVSGLISVENIKDAFYGTALTSINLSAWNSVTKSEDAFGKCPQLTTVTLPANFTIGKYLFNSCTALRNIDWSLYPNETAPIIATNSKIFQDLTAEQQAQITVSVPEAAFESFKADANWAYVNLQAIRKVEPGTFTVEANNIPKDLKEAKYLILTGLWDSTSFKALADALGNNTSTAGNSTLLSVDMSGINVAVGTNLTAQYPGALWGTVPKGIFQSCKTLETVVMPTEEQAANFRSFQQAFYGCEKLQAIDLSGCTGLNQTQDTFYGCSALTSVKLPGNYKFGTDNFNRCNALSLVDWTLFDGTTAPTFKTNSLPARGKNLTIKVPQAAFESFSTAAVWSGFNIEGVSGGTAVEGIEIQELPEVIYNLKGQTVSRESATPGIYIIRRGNSTSKVVIR